MDPGAVPGTSTTYKAEILGGTFELMPTQVSFLLFGGEIGSTCVERYGFCSVLYHRYRTI